jgi:glycosyltransferase involved in cell wall biosynthesis
VINWLRQHCDLAPRSRGENPNINGAYQPRAYEEQPMAVLQALASGPPVLASNLGGKPALLAPAGERWLSKPGDPVA